MLILMKKQQIPDHGMNTRSTALLTIISPMQFKLHHSTFTESSQPLFFSQSIVQIHRFKFKLDQTK